MPARRSSAAAAVQADADAELAADAPAKVRTVRAVPKPSAKSEAPAKKAKAEAAPKKKGPEFKALTAAAVRPRKFNSTMVPLDQIGGWEGVGDPPPDDFIDDIRKNGLEIPIVVDAEEDGSFTIVEGKRRLRAFQVLTEEGIEGFDAIPAVINPRRNQRDSRLRSLSANYQRGENVTGDARTVKALMDAGYKDKQIAEASNTPLATVRVLRDIAFKLHPTLFEATEQNKMKPWTAKEASRLGPEGQARLIAKLEANGRVTSDDAIEARRFRVIQAADSVLPKDMFDGDAELPYDDEEEDEAPSRDETFLKAEPKQGKKLSGADHIFNARRAVTIAKTELEALKPANRTAREQAALDALIDVIRLLDGEDEAVVATALADEELDDDELAGEELDDDDDDDDDDDEEEEEDDEGFDDEEEEENPF